MYDLLTVDWSLGNQCNLRCQYCHWELHNGENLFPNIETLQSAFDHLVDRCRYFSLIRIEFSGGEPTLSQSTQELIVNNKNKNVEFKLVSNGTATHDWWLKAKEHLYEVILTYHIQTDINHFINVIKLLDSTLLKVFVAIPADSWDYGIEAYNTIKAVYKNTHIQLLYKNFTRGNSIYQNYTKDQWKEYYHEQGIDISKAEIVEKTIEFKRVHNLNNYFGHLCWAGQNQIVIDNFGDVWRGWCKSNFCLGNVFTKTLELNTSPTLCPKPQCRNAFDLQARKSQGSWGMV